MGTDILNPPEMPASLPWVTSIAILAWVIFIIVLAWNVRNKGLLGVVNISLAFLLAIAVGSTIFTVAVWDWAPKQVTARVSTSAGATLLSNATGGILALNPGGSNATSDSQAQAKPQASLNVKVVENTTNQNVSVPPQPQTITEAPTYPFPAVTVRLSDGTEIDLCGFHASQVGNNWEYIHIIPCDAADKPSSTMLEIDPKTVVALKGNLPAIPAPIPLPTPTPLPTEPPSPVDPAELLKVQAKCWLNWANINLVGSDAKWGLLALPFGTNWELTGPGGFLDWGSMFFSANTEEWVLRNREWGLEYPINGTIARSFPGADDSATVVLKGINTELCVP